MARGDGIDRTNARNMRLTAAKIGNTQQHNEREKDSYVNQDIVPERTSLNVHFKRCVRPLWISVLHAVHATGPRLRQFHHQERWRLQWKTCSPS